ncbi:MAG: hypothetical protein K6F61_04995 [Clostridiales bacterium]|nr:hypothetical protein [Clostridiales bacterium]
MAEITKRNALLKCLKEQEELRNLCSVKYEGRYPMKGMEKEFNEQEQVCRILRELIQALESEPVRRAVADWQKEVISNGPSALEIEMKLGGEKALKLDGGHEPDIRFYEG